METPGQACIKEAPGQDKISDEMITHLALKAKQVLLEFINKTWDKGQLPSQWRTFVIS